MGLREFFKRNKSNSNYDYQVQQPDLSLSYNSGIRCDVNFGNLSQVYDQNGKALYSQEARVIYYMPDGKFISKNIAMDPMTMQDQQGNVYYDTKGYYQYLANGNYNLTKGFFRYEDVEQIQNGYIGKIEWDQKTGNPSRSFDKNLKGYYDMVLESKEYEKKLQEEKRFNDELKNQTVRVDQIKPHVKTSHAEDLSKYRNSDERF